MLSEIAIDQNDYKNRKLITKKLVQRQKIPAQINNILVWQWIITFCITAILFIVKSELALSAFLGGLICALPNVYFARQLFKRRIAQAAMLIRSVYIAEFIKLGLAITLLAIVLINYKGVHPITLFVTYFIAHSCMWAVPLITQIFSKPSLKHTH